jgi:hypothetical protein
MVTFNRNANAVLVVPSMPMSAPNPVIPTVGVEGLAAPAMHRAVDVTIWGGSAQLLDETFQMAVGTLEQHTAPRHWPTLCELPVSYRKFSNFGNLTIETNDEGLVQRDRLGPEQGRYKWQHDPPS